MLLPEKYERIFDVSSKGPSSGSFVDLELCVSIQGGL